MLALKEIITKNGISQRELAVAVGISQPAISQLLNHGRWPKRHTTETQARMTQFLSEKGIKHDDALKKNAHRDTSCGRNTKKPE